VKKSPFRAVAAFGLGWLFTAHLFAQQLATLSVTVAHRRVKAEASVEVFNLFNRPNVNGIDTVYGTPDFLGPIPQRFGDGVSSPANPTFGTPNCVAPARQTQLAMRLNF
jgi:hypothetical protein